MVVSFLSLQLNSKSFEINLKYPYLFTKQEEEQIAYDSRASLLLFEKKYAIIYILKKSQKNLFSCT